MRTLLYLLQVSACTGIFYGFYFLLLRKLTFFTLNRWYLLATLVVSFVIPVITIPVSIHEASPVLQPMMYVQQLQTEQPQVILATLQTKSPHSIDRVALLRVVYLAVAVLLALRLLYILAVFFSRMKGAQLLQIGAVKVLKGDKKLGNSSFLNVIFINGDGLEPNEIKQIIAHEMLHVKLMHSADRLFARIVQVILWFNPFAYCYIRSIEENHEFEVDRIAAGKDQKGLYAQLLFKLAVSGQSYLFHGFSKVPLKKRITMLFNKPTSNMKKIVYLLIVPLLVISCLAFANLREQPRRLDTNKNYAPKEIAQKRLKRGPVDTVLLDTVKKYRQRIKQTPAQRLAENKVRADFKAYTSSADYRYKNEVARRVHLQTLPYRVVGTIDSILGTIHLTGYKLARGGDNFIMGYKYGPGKNLEGMLKAGDEITVKSAGEMWQKNIDVVIQPTLITKSGKNILQITEQPAGRYPFLYEANRVRFADGQVANISTYPNGKWKSAVVTVSNGYKIRLNIKPTAPVFTGIATGDRVRFRFVHEVRTGDREYTVNDWVSLSKNLEDYGIKNPDFFFKFYVASDYIDNVKPKKAS